MSFQIAQILRERVARGECLPGQRIPTEIQLAKEFGVSVVTVQRALRDLQAEGLVARHRGRGSFISSDGPALLKTATSHDALGQMFSEEFGSDTEIIARETVRCPPYLAESFAGAKNLMRLKRLVHRDGRPWSYAVAHLLPEHGKKLSPSLLRRYPTFRLMRDVVGVPLNDVDMRIEARLPDAEVAEALKVGPLSPILTYKGRLHDGQKRTLIAIELSFPGDRFALRFNMDLQAGGTKADLP
ncbi:GntR family transcriptional regulator [Bradyrhizobium sp. CB82]|uniref:GntR family transcriptional regulator n=1 Tax=Bradyrhizobium sp. CB82 TaxID=3039159 RepID=UPI0024B0E2DA|nr:GntR family transcriptional regulator [Bradyrhizobium sp. CB82]WFU41527.1 GntR family transcriptional regulator [Bradyrhizobium sp. CB82]